MLVAGVLSAAGALAVGARRDPWGAPEWLVSLTGLVPATAMSLGTAFSWPGIVPQQVPAALPPVPLGIVASIAVAALAGVLSPVPPLLARSREAVA